MEINPCNIINRYQHKNIHVHAYSSTHTNNTSLRRVHWFNFLSKASLIIIDYTLKIITALECNLQNIYRNIPYINS